MLGRKGGKRRTMRGGVMEREGPFGGKRRTMRGGIFDRNAR